MTPEMDWLNTIWGTGTSLNCMQLSCRAIVVFFITLLLIRISGRRSFGVRTPLDNIIVILLGALLARAVVGASPFLPVVTASFAVVLLHRLFSIFKLRNKYFSKLIDGEKIVLYHKGRFLRDNMKRALICEEDIRQGIRESALMDDLELIDTIYMERNGVISIIKKKTDT